MILALDIGTKRIGVALGSPSTRLALPNKAIPRKNAENYVVTLVNDHNISTLVVGRPFNEDGSRNEACERVEQFCRRVVRRLNARSDAIKDPKFKIITVDEYGSSVYVREELQSNSAGRSKGERLKMRREGVVDCAAAAIILQQYLDNPDIWPELVSEDV